MAETLINKGKLRICKKKQNKKFEIDHQVEKIYLVAFCFGRKDNVREEIQELSMKMIGTMISGSNRVNENVMQSISFEEDKLPEKSEELPIGALDFLE